MREYIKIFLVELLVFSILFISNVSIQAQTSDEEVTAKLLNELGLVVGSDGDFHVHSKLTRAEAVTLIMRLTNDNIKIDESNIFTDVNEEDWFYEAVLKGYKLGIVNGYPDGTFKPSEAVSDQAFRKMLLEVMGYKYNSDFVWDDVGKLSEQIGISHTEDFTPEFNRKDAFDRIVLMLVSFYNRTDVLYIERLEELGKIDETQRAVFLNQADVNNYKILTIKCPEEGVALIRFNEPIPTKYSDLNIVIKDANGYLLNTTYQISGNQMTVKSDGFIEEQNYDLAVEGLKDLFGIELERLAYTFQYKVSNEVFDFYIDKIELMSSKYIKVTYSGEILEQSLTSSMFRSYINGERKYFGVKKLQDNEILLVLREPLVSNDLLELVFLGAASDIYGNQLYDGYSRTIVLSIESELENELRINSIVPVGNGVFRITYNLPVDISSAILKENYQVSDLSEARPYIDVTRVVHSGVGNMRNMQFDIVYDRMVDGNQYYLKATGVEAIFDSYRLESQQKKFNYYESENAFNIVSVKSIDNAHMILSVNQPIDEDDLLKAVIEIGGYSVFRRHLDEEDPKKIHVYMMNELVSEKTYSLVVSNLKSEYGMMINDKSMSFTASRDERINLLCDKKWIGDGNLLLTFNRMIDNFTVDGKIMLKTVSSDGQRINMSQSDYTKLSLNEIIIMKSVLQGDVDAIEFGALYLYGDQRYIGTYLIDGF